MSLGVAISVAALAGAGWAIKDLRAGPTPADASAADEPVVVCFGHVDVEPGVTSLGALQPGRVMEVLVRANEAVEAGTVLVRLDDRPARLRVQQAQADLAAAQAQLSQARKAPDQHRAKLAQQQAAIEATQRRLAAARLSSDRLQRLYAIEQAAAEEARAATELVKELEAVEQAEQAKRRELDLVDPSVPLARAEAEVAAKQAQLDEARHGLEECSLRAPGTGRVLRVLAAPGDVLGGLPRQPAVLFCPDGPRILRAEVAQEFADRLALGQVAAVQDDSSAGGTWRGRVVRLSDWYTQRRSP